MNEPIQQTENEKLIQDAEKRVRKIKKFYKELASWAGTSIFLIALNLFLSGSISWAKYPVFFWGIAIALQYFNILRLQKLDKDWEQRMMRKFTGREPVRSLPSETKEVDYSGELLNNEQVREKEFADLSEYRKLKKPWEDKDLV